jgi:DMSO/TMAO reductase YedYZ molybdopterin-dependent catalytic subunit
MRVPCARIGALGIVMTLGLLLTACAGRVDPAELDAVEVREYEGKDLSAINDFRENSIKGTQRIDQEAYRLEVTGLVDEPLSLAYDEVLDREQFEKVVTLYCVEGWSVDILWEGVKLSDILDQAEFDETATTVIFRAEDGYSSSLPLDFVLDQDLLLAYKMNGVTLPPERGFPFQVVAEDKLGYKWVKWVTSIEVSNDSDYEGFWEERGYSNEAEIDLPE